ncbi:hypothetical protein [Dechloromonas sp.]|uniref:hypothetical protein n=1 Tax=Dechloromonas sp. TaxID=1917218 RepID=UPI001219195D|nr:hypothetical protein [Dechloromonas sp.]MBU3697158.1 hypothetical protein [Dechloromonas sp.]TEX44217.1 MAG: hypothetical protein CFR70_14870 [Rhodocyclaceae bacterium]
MNWFGKLPGFRTSPPGLERDILRRLPRVLWLGTLLLALPAIVMRLLADEVVPDLSRLDIYSIALVVLHWTVVLTLAIGAAIVWLMKGPAYVADGYALDEAENPPDFRVDRSRGETTGR